MVVGLLPKSTYLIHHKSQDCNYFRKSIYIISLTLKGIKTYTKKVSKYKLITLIDIFKSYYLWLLCSQITL